MYTVGREIENAIQSMLSVSEEYANIQAKLDRAESDLGMLETLFNVSKYIGSDTEPQAVLNVLEDSIRGVFGTSNTQVIFDDKKRHLSYSTELYEHFDYETLTKQVEDTLVVDDLSESNISNLDFGSAMIIRLGIGKETYGYLVCYWHRAYEMNRSKMIFLQIISTQVSVFLKSANLVEEFKEMAVIDPLTGIYNRSHFANIVETTNPEFDESIILFDIDHFKRINDTKGHQFGDSVLIKFGEILTDVASANDGIPFKYGGEEFILNSKGGRENAQKIADEVGLRFFNETGYTVSSGISTMGYSCKIASYVHLIKQADDALYVSKQCGRNRATESSSDIQILKLSSNSLSKLLSKSFRQLTPMSLIRMGIQTPAVLTEEEFEALRTSVLSIGRIYDEVFITSSLDILYIVHGQVDVDEFIKRSKEILKQSHPEIEYEVHSLDRTFKEVLVHSSRVSELSQILGAELGFNSEMINKVRMACEWHDVGKLCTDPVVYNRDRKLTDDEYEVIKMHSWLSYCIANDHPALTEFANWVLYHHEDFNGNGYFGLKGEEIPFPAQIISLVDKFDALTEDRCYRPAYDWRKAMSILKEEAPKFDRDLFVKFEDLITRMMQTQTLELA